jgi:CHAD domain-containing protein
VPRILEKADTRPGTRGWQWALGARVARRASALRAAIDTAGGWSERLHKVRIALKKLRYAVELSASRRFEGNAVCAD